MLNTREKLIELLNDHTCLEDKDDCEEECSACIADHLIANDVMPVVWCEGCKHWEKVYGGSFTRNFGYCNECKIDAPSDHFCSYGERKEEV